MSVALACPAPDPRRRRGWMPLPDAAEELDLSIREVFAAVKRGDLFAAGDPGDSPRDVLVLADDVRRLRRTSPRSS